MPAQASSPEGRRLLEACEMFEVGLDLLRARYRREYPADSPEEIEERVRVWIRDRPFDSPGRPVELSRFRDATA